MVIYLDVLMAVNFLITYFSLKAAARLLHAGYSTRRLIAASVFGGISSLSAVIPLGFIASLLLKISLTAVITFIAFGFGGTDFNCVFDYADEFRKKSGGRPLKGLFFFSDACGNFPDEKKEYPTTFFVPETTYALDLESFVPGWVELVHYKD